MVQSIGEEGEASGSDEIIRTIHDIMMEKGTKVMKLLTNLNNVLQVKKRNLEAMERKYSETRKTISNLIAENNKLHQSCYEEMKEMQFSIREHFQWICNDHEISSLDLEKQQRELELRSIELQKHEVLIEDDMKKLAKEIEENAAKISSIHDQKEANKTTMKLADDHKREMEILHEKIFFLEKQLNSKQALEIQKEHLKESLNVLERSRELEVPQKIVDLLWKLKEMEEEVGNLESLKALNCRLSMKERVNNYELQETRKVLIEVICKLNEYNITLVNLAIVLTLSKNPRMSDHIRKKGLKELPEAVDVGLKRMGELSNKPFYDAIIAKNSNYNETEAKDLASEECKFWQEYLQDPNCHPFEVISFNGMPQGVMVKYNAKLEILWRDLGEEVYKAVMTAYIEISDHRIYGTMELWNFTESRKATLKEGVSGLLKMWDAKKRRRIT